MKSIYMKKFLLLSVLPLFVLQLDLVKADHLMQTCHVITGQQNHDDPTCTTLAKLDDTLPSDQQNLRMVLFAQGMPDSYDGQDDALPAFQPTIKWLSNRLPDQTIFVPVNAYAPGTLLASWEFADNIWNFIKKAAEKYDSVEIDFVGHSYGGRTLVRLSQIMAGKIPANAEIRMHLVAPHLNSFLLHNSEYFYPGIFTAYLGPSKGWIFEKLFEQNYLFYSSFLDRLPRHEVVTLIDLAFLPANPLAEEMRAQTFVYLGQVDGGKTDGTLISDPRIIQNTLALDLNDASTQVTKAVHRYANTDHCEILQSEEFWVDLLAHMQKKTIN